MKYKKKYLQKIKNKKENKCNIYIYICNIYIYIYMYAKK